MEKYDAFISYRRESGFLLAQVLKEKLEKKGISCFLDLDKLSSGKFDDKIYDAIDNSNNFIIILANGDLDNCNNPKDWVRKEIVKATESHKKIIPVFINGYEWPNWDESCPKEIQNLENINGISITKEYLDAMINKIISYMTDVNEISLTIATTNLTVVDSFIYGFDPINFFKNYLAKVELKPYKWDDTILKDLSNNVIDIAIFNKELSKEYLEKHNDAFCIINDVCSSMGGRNFYILASKESSKWKDTSIDEFKKSLDSDTVIVVQKNSDRYKNLLYILDMDENNLKEKGVKIKDCKPNLSFFEFDPNILVIGGQDIRYAAEKIGTYTEIISFDDLPLDKKEYFLNSSINSLLMSNSCIEKLKKHDVNEIFRKIVISFYRNFLTEDKNIEIRKKFENQLRDICDEETIKYVIKKILFETYRLM